MKSNYDKCHLIVENTNNVSYISTSYIYLDNEFIEREESVNLLGVKIDKTLSFDGHVANLLKTGNQKLHALMRISKFLREDKLKLIIAPSYGCLPHPLPFPLPLSRSLSLYLSLSLSLYHLQRGRSCSLFIEYTLLTFYVFVFFLGLSLALSLRL